jgi:hypothetical protein
MTATLHTRLAGTGSSRASGARPFAGEVDATVKMVLRLLREHMDMDVAFVAHFTEGNRQFRVVESEVHGAAAALAAGQGTGQAAGVALDTPILLRDGRMYGRLCCFSRGNDPAVADRDLRSLRYAAQLAARLLDNQQVLRELHRGSVQH